MAFRARQKKCLGISGSNDVVTLLKYDRGRLQTNGEYKQIIPIRKQEE